MPGSPTNPTLAPFPSAEGELRAAWLGSWIPPWTLDRGRRWGDPAWTLTALTHAWALGGREGRWPRLSWHTGKTGPVIASHSEDWSPAPDRAWVALLRHGSSEVPADHRGKRESELQDWCWKSLLEGDATPWMSLGTVLFTRRERSRWLPVHGAVKADGSLLLPPFLAPLVPAGLLCLPVGWWEFLLRAMDREGRLLPEGAPPGELPWPELFAGGPAPFEPLVIEALPDALAHLRDTPWVFPVPGGGFMLDPRLRSWARGFGACPTALGEVVSPSLSLGDPPIGWIQDLLAGRPLGTDALPASWASALAQDMAGEPVEIPSDPTSHPTLTRLAMRWGAPAAPPAPDYPAWGDAAHPCADPFHWMAEGVRAYRAQDMELALRAFTWAHAHFLRLASPSWADRAAANATVAALYWGDLPAMLRWRALQAEEPSPYRELQEAQLLAMRDEWDRALPLLRQVCAEHPHVEQPWILLGTRGVDLDRRDWVEEVLPRIQEPGIRAFLQAYLEGFPGPPPASADRETTLMWAYERALRQPVCPSSFWEAWHLCRNQPLRLQTGLGFLEARPGERTSERLLGLQVLADRAGSPRHQARLAPLWPAAPAEGAEDPEAMLKGALARRSAPAWIIWGPSSAQLGHGGPAPAGALTRLNQDGSLAPFEHGGLVWRGFPLRWEGGVVGHALAAHAPQQLPDTDADLHLLAPWVSRLLPRETPDPAPEAGSLLTDGSEPMAGLLRELTRVAPSELTLLVLGPTGSGKELTAREIHRRSGRPGPLVAVNCSAFAESLLESELFGHVKGAFTGADRDRRGAIEAADKGTLFLDEIADLSPRIQSLFLRVLQEREVRRVGSERAVHVDVRFVAATHRSLEQLAEAGTFRRDLLYRLQGSVLSLPALRDRRHEFPYLVPRLVAQVARDARRACPELAPGLPQALARLSWPGNFRELRHALERALLRCGGGPLKPEHFPELQAPEQRERGWEQATRDFQKRLLTEALHRHRFQVTETAEALGITRPTLYLAARRVGLDLVAARKGWESAQE